MNEMYGKMSVSELVELNSSVINLVKNSKKIKDSAKAMYISLLKQLLGPQIKILESGDAIRMSPYYKVAMAAKTGLL